MDHPDKAGDKFPDPDRHVAYENAVSETHLPADSCFDVEKGQMLPDGGCHDAATAPQLPAEVEEEYTVTHHTPLRDSFTRRMIGAALLPVPDVITPPSRPDVTAAQSESGASLLPLVPAALALPPPPPPPPPGADLSPSPVRGGSAPVAFVASSPSPSNKRERTADEVADAWLDGDDDDGEEAVDEEAAATAKWDCSGVDPMNGGWEDDPMNNPGGGFGNARSSAAVPAAVEDENGDGLAHADGDGSQNPDWYVAGGNLYDGGNDDEGAEAGESPVDSSLYN
jgi:hypothetical protein